MKRQKTKLDIRLLILLFFLFTTSFLSAKTVLRSIVIDPGHGGKDVGAQSRDGKFYEKDLALSFARQLKKNIEKKLKLKVVLTRNSDIFVSLEDRVGKANKLKADLFISIHLNAAKRKGAHGFEVFFLSADASDTYSKEVAEAENRYLCGFEGTKNNNDREALLTFILQDLAKNEYLSESKYFASVINDSLSKKYKNRESRRIRQAPLCVLAGVMMPAVLLELGFITNSTDLKNLRNKKITTTYSDALVGAIQAFDRYLGAALK